MNLSVPETLFLTLQATFQAEAKRLCADMAQILGVPEKELQSKILKGPKLQLTLVEDSERPLTCLVPTHIGATLTKCRKPCLLGTSRCADHQGHPDPVSQSQEPPTSLKPLQRLETIVHNDIPLQLWVDEETGHVFTADHKHIGMYENERLTLWTCPPAPTPVPLDT